MTSASPSSAHLALQVGGLSVYAGDKALLRDVSFESLEGSFTTVIGPSGCGKSTLIQALAGITDASAGTIRFAGHRVEQIKEEYPLAVGYIPQFGTFHSELTVAEILATAADLRLPRSVSATTRREWIAHLTDLAGIASLLSQRFATLSGGQRRRLALAEELIGDPSFLLLDELTSGLDVYSDGQIMRFLRELAHRHNKTIVLVTHNTQHLDQSDAVILLNEGRLMHHGTPANLLSAHGAQTLDELFGSLSTVGAREREHPRAVETQPPELAIRSARPPSGFEQLLPLLGRQCKLLLRDRSQIAIQTALLVVFPLLVIVFALDGLPEVRAMGIETSNVTRLFEQRLYYLQNAVETSALVSGLAMFQVVLLALMGANNGAREIAKERGILQKESYAGLSATACVTSKFLHVAFFSGLQALLMTGIVKGVCGFPGDFGAQFLALFLTTLAIGTTCLAISAASPNAERASLLSIYLVGFQLPLSGAALALPDWLAQLCHPFIGAYWGWSAYLRTLEGSRYFQVVADSTRTHIASFDSAVIVLLIHILVGFLAAIFFTARLRRQQ